MTDLDIIREWVEQVGLHEGACVVNAVGTCLRHVETFLARQQAASAALARLESRRSERD